MVTFNTSNLKKVVSLARLDDYVGKVEVKMAKYDGNQYLEGVILLNIPTGDAMELRVLTRFNELLRNVWQSSFIQIGTRNRKPALFIYEQRGL